MLRLGFHCIRAREYLGSMCHPGAQPGPLASNLRRIWLRGWGWCPTDGFWWGWLHFWTQLLAVSQQPALVGRASGWQSGPTGEERLGGREATHPGSFEEPSGDCAWGQILVYLAPLFVGLILERTRCFQLRLLFPSCTGDPHNDPNAQGDAFKTLFVARVVSSPCENP